MNVLALSYLFPNHKQPSHGIFIYNRLKAVSKYHNIKVVAPVPWFPLSRYFSKYKELGDVPYFETCDGLNVHRPRFFIIPRYFKWLDPIFYLFCSACTILSINKKCKFDIVDVHWAYPDILAGYCFAKLFHKPLIVTLRGKEVICYGEKSVRKKIIDFLLRRADRVVCLSKELSEIACNIGVCPQKINIISNGVDVDMFKYIDQTVSRKRLNLPLDKKIILSVGYLIERKGFHKIIGVLPDLLKKYPDIQLYIVGSLGAEGDFQEKLIQMIEELSLKNNVFLVGKKLNEELFEWYNAADVFCLATSGEGSPNVVLEALACGCPVIASSVGGIPEIICKDFLGNTFDCLDVNDLKLTLVNYFEKKLERERIRNYMERFSWDWCAKQVVDVYERSQSDIEG